MAAMKFVAVFCAFVVSTQAQLFPLDEKPFKEKMSVVFTQYNVDTEKAFIKYAPADPDDHDVDTDGMLDSTSLVYTTEGNVAEYWGMTASHDASKIWFNNYRGVSLTEYDVAESELNTVAVDLTDGLEDMAYDRVTKILYWTDSMCKAVFAFETSSYRHLSKIWKHDEVAPYAIALHTTKRKLFFGVYRTQGTRISQTELIKCNLDGSNVEAILRFPDVIRPRGMTIDFSDDKLYWTDINFSLDSVVMACDLDGRLRRTFFSSSTAFLWDIAHYKDYFYVTDLVNTTTSEYNIYIRQKNGRRGEIRKTNMRPRNVDIYAPNEVSRTKVSNECDGAPCEHICVAKPGGYKCLCSCGYVLVDGYKCVSDILDDDYLLVADIAQKRVFQVELATSAALVDDVMAMPWDDQTDEKIFAVAVDQKNGDFAWYDLDNKEIVWGNKRIRFTDPVSSIVIHCCEDIIYWSSNKEILSWDGKSIRPQSLYVLSFFSDAQIRQITIDCNRLQLYWVEYDPTTRTSTVKRSNLKGRDVEIVLKNLPPTKGITIDYETYTLYIMTMLAKKLYSLPLRQLENIPSTDPGYHQYEEIDISDGLDRVNVFIWDIRVKNGMVYLIDTEHFYILRFSIRLGPSSMENYGPKKFFFAVTLDFYDKQYYDRFIGKLCDDNEFIIKPTTETITTRTFTPTTTGRDCIALLTGIDDFNEALNAYIACIFAGITS